jgi:hypothetical protein
MDDSYHLLRLISTSQNIQQQWTHHDSVIDFDTLQNPHDMDLDFEFSEDGASMLSHSYTQPQKGN